MERIRVFAPATVANVACGFDVLGMALEAVGDVLEVRASPKSGVRMQIVSGMNLSTAPGQNVCEVATLALLEALGSDRGFEIDLYKGILPGSGIGSSAASSAGAVWAVNCLLGEPFSLRELVAFAMEGERLASGAAHADNVAPALLGGFTLVRSYDPLDIVALPVPEELHAVVLHPHIELRTSDSRKVLKTNITLEQGIRQWGNLGGLVAGLYESDYALIGRSLEDHVIEPLRSLLIPHYAELKATAREAGALGSGISGSGPSVFALCQGPASAREVARALEQTYQLAHIPFDLHLSRVSRQGVRAISDE